jgi:SAM-dependent methyltransferase
VTFGLYANETHREFLQKFLERVGPRSILLSAACGAGRYDGLLLEAGHSVVGIDLSEGMLKRARERFPDVRYEKLGLQEMDFREEFDGAICMDAMEHIPPEDWPGIMRGFQEALMPGGALYFTLDTADEAEVAEAYERAKKQGLPVVFGEVADKVEEAYEQVTGSETPEEVVRASSDVAVYHYYPPLEQVHAWIREAGMTVEEQGTGNWYEHFLVRA